MINEIIWPLERIHHIAKHGVLPNEVEEVCFGDPLVLRGRSDGENPVYYLLGETESGRRLFFAVIEFPDGRGYPITARPMSEAEERRFKRWRNR